MPGKYAGNSKSPGDDAGRWPWTARLRRAGQGHLPARLRVALVLPGRPHRVGLTGPGRRAGGGLVGSGLVHGEILDGAPVGREFLDGVEHGLDRQSPPEAD